ncbi:MAG: diadenylate cyclase [Phycisphaerae bacterium]
MESIFNNLRSFYTALQSDPLWKIALEFLLIGAVVLWVVKFLQGTRGARLFRGILVLLILAYAVVRLVGGALDLGRIEFLFSRFLLFASFAIAIVFQPELRRAFMRLGETRLFRGNLNMQVAGEIDKLVEACQFLSRRKIGAIIAIEREEGLGGLTEGNGVPMNAELTVPLLTTIFWPNSPLHDLGVVISNGKIAYAKVQFSSAAAEEVERELGSRHRAALGLSQEYDAVVIVCSEETGDISLAVGGALMRKLTLDALRERLEEYLAHGSIPANQEEAEVEAFADVAGGEEAPDRAARRAASHAGGHAGGQSGGDSDRKPERRRRETRIEPAERVDKSEGKREQVVSDGGTRTGKPLRKPKAGTVSVRPD